MSFIKLLFGIICGVVILAHASFADILTSLSDTNNERSLVYFQLPFSCSGFSNEQLRFLALPGYTEYGLLPSVISALTNSFTADEVCNCLNIQPNVTLPYISVGNHSIHSHLSQSSHRDCQLLQFLFRTLSEISLHEQGADAAFEILHANKAAEAKVIEKFSQFWLEEERKLHRSSTSRFGRKIVQSSRKYNDPLRPVTVLAARHDEPIEWLAALDPQRFHVVIGVKPGARLDDIPSRFEVMTYNYNIGDENSVFLQYILQNYHSGTLSPSVAFIHAHESSWHSPLSMRDRLNSFNFGVYPYVSLNYEKWFCYPHESQWAICNHAFHEVILPHMPQYHLDPQQLRYKNLTLCTHFNAQFVVTRERILSRPYSLYEKAFHYIDPFINVNISDPKTRAALVAEFSEEGIKEVEDLTAVTKNVNGKGRLRVNPWEFTWHLLFGEPLQETNLPRCLKERC